MTPTHRITQVALISLLVFAAVPAAAGERDVVVLPFSGAQGSRARNTIVAALKQRYTLIPAETLQAACQRLHLEISRGDNLAVCAQEVGAAAIVGGSVKGRLLNLAVFSGTTGEAVTSQALPWAKKPTRAQMREALRVAVRGIEAVPAITPPVVEATDDALTFSPEAIERTETPPALGPYGDDAERDSPFTLARAAAEAEPAPTAVAADHDPKVSGQVGLGIWMRSFSPENPRGEGSHPTYDTGAAVALRFGGQVRPFAFFLDNFAADIFARFHYQLALGLQSTLNDTSGTITHTGPFGTSMSELLLDVGYAWNILDRNLGPRVTGSLGFGLSSFSVNWEGETALMPNTSYPFVPLRLGINYPFAQLASDAVRLGAHALFDYRLVISLGDVSDAAWYGPGSASGLSFAVGLNASVYRWLVSVEYAYTGYSLSFSEADARAAQEPPLRAADGATDRYHAVLLHIGYSY